MWLCNLRKIFGGKKIKILSTNLQMQWDHVVVTVNFSFSCTRWTGQVQMLKLSSSHFTNASYVLNVSVQSFGFGWRHHSITYSRNSVTSVDTRGEKRPQLNGPRLRRKLNILGNGKKEMNKHVLLCLPLPLWCDFPPAASPLFNQLKLSIWGPHGGSTGSFGFHF